MTFRRLHVFAGLAVVNLFVAPAAPALTPKPPPKEEAKPQKQTLPPLSPPLGRIGDVVQPVPKGGIPGGEKIVIGKLEGCREPQAFYLERFLTQGALGAAEQVHDWLGQNPAARRRLFGANPKKDPLAQAIARARSGSFYEGETCPKEPPFTKDGRTVAPQAPRALCKGERSGPKTDPSGGLWLAASNERDGALKRRDFTAAVLLAPPAEAGAGAGRAAKAAPDAPTDAGSRAAAGASEGATATQDAAARCAPRMSASIFDAQARTRLRYHADWAGAAELEVLGDRCTRLLFRFDAERRRFEPVEDFVPGCKRK